MGRRSQFLRRLQDRTSHLYFNFGRFETRHPSLAVAKHLCGETTKVLVRLNAKDECRATVHKIGKKCFLFLYRGHRFAGVLQLQNNLSIPAAEFHAEEGLTRWLDAMERLSQEDKLLIA